MLAALLRSRRFAPLFGCQLFAAFNDNFVKNALAILVIFQIGEQTGKQLATLATALFILPFFVVSALGGQIADRFDKSVVARQLKLFEIGVAVIAGAGFILHSVFLLFVALFLTGVLSALFGPVKYGILPDHLKREELVAGNALVETATFLAILAGTVGGGVMVEHTNPWAIAAMTLGVSVLSWGCATLIPPTGSRAPDLVIDDNIARSTFALVGELRKNPRLWISAIAISGFWMVGAIVTVLIPVLAADTLGGRPSVATLFIALFTIGIAVGSLLAAKLSHRRILLVLTPIGGVLTGIFALDLSLATYFAEKPAAAIGWLDVLATPSNWRIMIDLVGLAAAGGLFVVPVFAFLQAEAGEDRRARVVAANNVLNAAFMVVGTILLIIGQAAGLSTPLLIGIVGAWCLITSPLIGLVLPGSMLRDAAYLILSLIFRVEVRGMNNLTDAPTKAVIAVNHTSLLDASLVMSLLADEPVFAINSMIAERWWVKPFLKLVRAFPMDPTKPLATRQLINLVKEGNRLVIFPEGRITVTGSLMKVYEAPA